MSVWSYSTLEIATDRKKIKISVRDIIKEYANNKFEAKASIELKAQDEDTQKWIIKLQDSSEVVLFSKSVSKLVYCLRQIHGIIYVECFVEGRL